MAKQYGPELFETFGDAKSVHVASASDPTLPQDVRLAARNAGVNITAPAQVASPKPKGPEV